jgi:hypothetical protein
MPLLPIALTYGSYSSSQWASIELTSAFAVMWYPAADAAAHDATQRVRAGCAARRPLTGCALRPVQRLNLLERAGVNQRLGTVCVDQIHLPSSFHVCLVTWPSVTSFTSMSCSDLGCLSRPAGSCSAGCRGWRVQCVTCNSTGRITSVQRGSGSAVGDRRPEHSCDVRPSEPGRLAVVAGLRACGRRLESACSSDHPACRVATATVQPAPNPVGLTNGRGRQRRPHRR